MTHKSCRVHFLAAVFAFFFRLAYGVTLQSVLSASNIRPFDLVILMGNAVVHIVAGVSFFCLHVVRRSGLRRVAAGSAQFVAETDLSGHARRGGRGSSLAWFHAAETFLAVSAVLSFATATYLAAKPVAPDGKTWMSWALATFMGVEYLLSVMNPFVFGPCALLIHYIHVTILYVELWTERIEKLALGAREKGQLTGNRGVLSQQDNIVKSIVSEGMKKCHLIESFNKEYSPITLAIYIYFIIIGSIYCYGVMAPLVTSFNLIKVCFSLSNFFLATGFFAMVVKFSSLGQQLIDRRSELRRVLERITCANFEHLGAGTVREMDVLLDRLESSVRLAPLSCFEMSHSSLTGLVGAIITYMIVLLQFRA